MTSTKKKYSKSKSTTLYIPILEDSMPKRYRVDEAHDLLSQVVVVLDAEIFHWISPWSSTVMGHLLLDTQSQKFPGLEEAGFYASSNQTLQHL